MFEHLFCLPASQVLHPCPPPRPLYTAPPHPALPEKLRKMNPGLLLQSPFVALPCPPHCHPCPPLLTQQGSPWWSPSFPESREVGGRWHKECWPSVRLHPLLRHQAPLRPPCDSLSLL